MIAAVPPPGASRSTVRWLGASVPFAVLLVLGGCGDGREPAAAAPESAPATTGDEQAQAQSQQPQPLKPITLLPDEAIAVVRVDAEQLRRSPYADHFTGWLASMGNRPSVDAEAVQLLQEVFEITDHAVAALVGFGPEGVPDEFVAVFRGRYEDEALLERWAGERARTERRGGHGVVLSGGVGAVALDEQTWLMASEGQLDAALARVEQPASFTLLSSEPLGSMAERVRFDRSTVAAVVETTEEIRAQLHRRGGGALPADTIDAMRVVGLRLDADRGVELETVARLADKGAARKLTAHADANIDKYGGHPLVRLMGLSALFGGASTRTEGAHAVLGLQLDDAETRALLARFDEFVHQLASGSSGRGASFKFRFGTGSGSGGSGSGGSGPR